MCIHGNKSQQERDWVLSGKLLFCPSFLNLDILNHKINHLSINSNKIVKYQNLEHD